MKKKKLNKLTIIVNKLVEQHLAEVMSKFNNQSDPETLERQKAAKNWIAAALDVWEHPHQIDQDSREQNLMDGLSTFSELGLWTDAVDGVGVEHALLIWALVETARNKTFPESLRA